MKQCSQPVVAAARCRRLGVVSLAAVLALPPAALAQQIPDAGRVLQELAPTLQAPRPSQDVSIESPGAAPLLSGGVTVTLQTVEIGGNTVFSAEDLLAVLGDVKGKVLDFAGLQALAERISAHYREAGYPFARAYLPQQAIAEGKVKIEVLEGRFGRVLAEGDADLAEPAQGFLSSLVLGEVIERGALERTTLILDDQPGIKTAPIIRPGQEVGTGDLSVRVRRENAYSASVGIDNHGNRYTGSYRARVDFDANSPFLLGDQISLKSFYSDQRMWMGLLGYSLPLGTSGLRGHVSHTRTAYELGEDFASLRATGTADVSSVGASYPVIRSRRTNMNLSVSLQHKKLKDRQGTAGTESDKRADTLPVALNMDMRDGLGGGGITYGTLTWTAGRLALDDAILAADATTARTAGQFDKLNLDAARYQLLNERWALFGRVSAQWTRKNLDSSERFGLGGPSGVRAYPSGEGYGAEGWLAQVELRYSSGAFAPYVFTDLGAVKINKDTWAAGDNRREITGGGIGLRYNDSAWNADVAVAWRINGGRPLSDSADRLPVVWARLQYQF